MRRSDQRRAAVFAVYQHDLTARSLVESLGPNASLFSRSLALAAVDRAEELDAVIDRHAHGHDCTSVSASTPSFAPTRRASCPVLTLPRSRTGGCCWCKKAGKCFSFLRPVPRQSCL